MLYNRSLEIERRLDDVLKLVREGQQSTPTLSKALNISEPTVSRCLRALRNRGYAIRAVKRGETCRMNWRSNPPSGRNRGYDGDEQLGLAQ